MSGNLALTNSSGEPAEVAVTITDRESERRVLDGSYQVPASDDGILEEDVVRTTGSYDVEVTIADTDQAASAVWRLPADDGVDYYTVRASVLSDGSLDISGDGV